MEELQSHPGWDSEETAAITKETQSEGSIVTRPQQSRESYAMAAVGASDSTEGGGAQDSISGASLDTPQVVGKPDAVAQKDEEGSSDNLATAIEDKPAEGSQVEEQPTAVEPALLVLPDECLMMVSWNCLSIIY